MCLSKRLIALALCVLFLIVCVTGCKDSVAPTDSSADGTTEETSSADSSSDASVDTSDNTSAVSSTDSSDGSFDSTSAESASTSIPNESVPSESTSQAEDTSVNNDPSVSEKPSESQDISENTSANEPPADTSSVTSSSDNSTGAADVSSAAPSDSSVADVSSADTSSSAPDNSSTAPAPDESSSFESTSGNDDSSAHNDSSAPEPPQESSEAPPVDPTTPLNELFPVTANPIDSYFNDSVFIGYSIMMHFGRYVEQWRMEVDPSVMGDALFCAAPGISFNADATETPATSDTRLPLFRGDAYNFADLPTATGSNTMYIGLMVYSDLKWGRSPATAVVDAYGETVRGINRIREKNPDLNIVILSGTYNSRIFEGLKQAWQDNDKVYEYNNLVLNYCNKNGIDFIDVATPLTDHRGYFVQEYASDDEYHIIKEAFCFWVEALRNYAAAKQNGTWENIDKMPPLPYLEP